MNPSEKDVTDSWVELLVNITAYAYLAPGVTEIKINYYAMVKNGKSDKSRLLLHFIFFKEKVISFFLFLSI